MGRKSPYHFSVEILLLYGRNSGTSSLRLSFCYMFYDWESSCVCHKKSFRGLHMRCDLHVMQTWSWSRLYGCCAWVGRFCLHHLIWITLIGRSVGQAGRVFKWKMWIWRAAHKTEGRTGGLHKGFSVARRLAFMCSSLARPVLQPAGPAFCAAH